MENYRLTQTGEEVQEILNGAAMQTDLTAENERAEGAEQTIQGNIDEEERRAKAAEETLSGAIGDEELRAKAAEEALGDAIDGINAKIPAAASSENKLADQDFVNSSIETATATFRGTYNLVSDLHLAVDATHEQIATLLGTVIAEADNNDYSYVLIPTSAQTPTEIASIEKYTFGANGWAFAYALNNSGFTSAQWAAINSGITSGLVSKLNALPTNTDLLALLAGKQDVLTFDDVPVEGSNNPVKSGGVHSAIDDEKTARVNAINQLSGRVDTIEGEIPAQASSENQLADKAYVNSSISTNTATYRGSFNLVADLGLSVSATHEQIGTALAGEISTADNNDYAYVQVPTSDETPSQILKVERYKFNGTAWAFEYELNNSGFTSAQWAALNSGITSGLVGKLNALPTNDELTLALAGKQDVLTFDNTPTENSNNPVKSGGVYAADKALSDAIEAILLLIPSAATSLNKLVDTDLMNSSISTATAIFRGTFNLVSDLSLDLTATHAQIATALAGEIATADNNDYCFVQIPTAVGTPTEIASTDRYKFNGTAWAFEYTLNNSGFTSAQWAAINSAITTELVAKLTALPTNAELLESLGLLSSGISGINAKIPSAASSENKLVDGTAMETYVAQIVNAIDATFNVTSTDGHVTLAITQVNGAITSVQLTTSDIASASALNLKASQADLTALAGRVTTAEGNITSLTGRMTTAEGDIDTLTSLYNALQQSAPQVIQPTDTWPVANPSTTVIYRVIDRVNTPPEYYSDYMWNGTSMVLMATYNNAIDTTPKKDSANLITSGGVFANIGAFDISEYHKSGSTLATYADLTAALAALPSDFQKGGMSIKFVQSSDNKYEQFRCMADSFTTDVTQWQGVDDAPTVGSNNLVKSGGVANMIVYLVGWNERLSLSNVTGVGQYWYNSSAKNISYCRVWNGTPESSLFTFIAPENNKIYIFDGRYYRWNGTELELAASKIVTLADIYHNQSRINLGDIYYNTGSKELRRKTEEFNYIVVPFYDSTIYLYDNDIYIWNGTDLVIRGAEIVNNFNSTASTKSLSAGCGKILNENKANRVSVNLFNKDEQITGKYISSDGTLGNDANSIISSLIEIKPNTLYSWQGGDAPAYGYDIRCVKADGVTAVHVLSENGTELSYSGLHHGLIKTPSDAKYFQFTIKFTTNASIADTQCLIESDEIIQEYYSYDKKVLSKDEIPLSLVSIPNQVTELNKQSALYNQIKILCIGNSFLDASINYVPFILSNIAPDLDVTIVELVRGGSSLQDWYNILSGTDTTSELSLHIFKKGYTKWDNKYGASVPGNTNQAKMQNALKMYAYDAIVFQQVSTSVANYSTYQPYLNNLISGIFSVIEHPCKIGWLLTPTRDSNLSDSVTAFNGEISSVEHLLNETAIEFVIPCGTAFQNARTTSLQQLGEDGNLIMSNHPQAGLPCQILAYSFILKIFDLMGLKQKSIYGEDTRVDADWQLNKGLHDLQGLSPNNPVVVTDAYARVAQICAMIANKNPYVITDCSSL